MTNSGIGRMLTQCGHLGVQNVTTRQYFGITVTRDEGASHDDEVALRKQPFTKSEFLDEKLFGPLYVLFN